MEYAKSDEKSLGSAAQEVLKHISLSCPELLTAHILGMCRDVQEQAPTESEPNSPAVVDTLKACAAFAKQYTKEIPTDRRFTQAMTNFALHGTPPEAAKHAVSIIMATSERKEMVARDLLHQCIEGFEYGEKNFLSRLAALSQLWLLAPLEMDEDGDAVVDIVIKEILSKNRTPSTAPADKREWSDEIDTECQAKCWALKVLVNRIRSHTKKESLRDVSRPVYELLSRLVAKDGELAAEAKNTPPAHKSRLLLLAARLYFKLCTSRDHEQLLSAHEFNKLALIAQYNLLPVRTSFMMRLRKYLSAGILPTRFFTIPFLLAFEPNAKLKAETSTWLTSQYNRLQKQKAQRLARNSADSKDTSSKADTTLESVFARLISLLAHHPDYPLSKEELTDFSRYFIYYLSNVANDDNVSLIFHIAQKVKTCKDVIDLKDAKAEEGYEDENWDERLYTLSDLAQMTIRCYEEAHSWNILTLPTYARITLPHSLFKEIKDHDVSIAIAEKMYLPDAEDIREGVEELVKKKASAHSRKRKSEGGELGEDQKSTKKSKRLPVRESKPKTSTKKKSNTTSRRKADSDGGDDDASSPEDSSKHKRKSATTKPSTGNSVATRRRSGRTSGASGSKNYADRDSSEDEKELEELNRDDDTPVEEGSSPDTEAGDDDKDDGDEGEEMQVEKKGAVDGAVEDVEEEEEEEAEAETEAEAEEEFDVPSSPKGKTKAKARAKASASPKASKVVKKTAPKAAPKGKPTGTPAPKAKGKAAPHAAPKTKPKAKTRGKA